MRRLRPISVFGNQISYVAIPLTVILILDASVVEMGVLTAAGRAPWLLVGLFAGVWIDRLRRRRVLIVADLLRAGLLALLALLAYANLLSIELMVAIAFLCHDWKPSPGVESLGACRRR